MDSSPRKADDLLSFIMPGLREGFPRALCPSIGKPCSAPSSYARKEAVRWLAGTCSLETNRFPPEYPPTASLGICSFYLSVRFSDLLCPPLGT